MTDVYVERPGIELKKKIFSKGLNMSQFAYQIEVPVSRISDIVSGKREITLDSAKKFAKYFGDSVQYWLYRQSDYNIYKDQHKSQYLQY